MIFSQLSPWFTVASARADLAWDGTLTSGTGGGSGTWIDDGATANWYLNGGGDTTWTSSQNAVFGGTAGTVYVDSINSTTTPGVLTVGGITFDTPGYVIAGNTSGDVLTLGNFNDDIVVNANAEISVNLGGTGGLVKDGLAKLILSGSNGNTGSTTINSGVLQYGSAFSIGGSGPGSVTINSDGVAAFDFAGVQAALSNINTASTGVISLTSNSASENIDLAAAGLGSVFFGATGTMNYTGVLTPNGDFKLGGGGGTLIFNQVVNGSNLFVGGPGGGTVQLTSTATYTGSVTVQQGGVLQFGSDNLLPISTVNVNNATVDLKSTSQAIGTFSLNGGSIIGNGTLVLAGSNGTTFQDTDPGRVFVTGNNTISTGLQINTADTGIAPLYNVTTGGTSRILSPGRNIVVTSGTLTITGRITDGGPTARGILSLSGGGVVILANPNSDNDFHAHATGISQIPNTTLDTSVIMNNDLTILRLGANEQLPDDANVILDSLIGGGIDLGVYSETIGAIYTANKFQGNIFGSGTLKLSSSGTGAGTFVYGNQTIGGEIDAGFQLTTTSAAYRKFQSGGSNGGFIIAGRITEGTASGTLGVQASAGGFKITSDNNAYSGGTLLNGGVLSIAGDTSLGTGPVIFAVANATLASLSGDRTLANPIVLGISQQIISGGNSFTMTGTMTNSGGGAKILINNITSGNYLTLSDIVLSDSATVGKVTLNNTGDTIVNGVISNGPLVTSGTLGVAGAGTLTLNGVNTFSALQTGTSSITILGASEVLDDGSRIDFAGGTLDQQGGTETIGQIGSLLANSQVINPGLLILSNGSTTATVGAGTINFGANLQLTSDTAATRTFDGGANAAILNLYGVLTEGSEPAALAFAGTKTLFQMSGANNYSGGTTLLSGTLALDNTYGTVLGSGALTTGSGVGLGSTTITALNGDLSFSNNVNLQGTTQFVGPYNISLTGTVTSVSGTGIANTLTNNMVGPGLFLQDVALSNSGTTGKLTVNGTAGTTTWILGAITNGSTATSGTLNYAGGGVLILDGASAFSNLLLTSGAVQLNNSERLGSTTTLNFAGGTLDVQGYFQTVGQIGTMTPGTALVGSGTLALGNGSNTVTLAAGTYNLNAGLQLTTDTAATRGFDGAANAVFFNINGDVSEGAAAGSLNLSGAKSLFVLSGNSNYSGGTTLQSGTLGIGSDTALGVGPLITGSAGKPATLFASGGDRSIANDLNLSGTTLIVGENSLSVHGTLTNSGTNINTLVNNLTSGTLTFGNVSLSDTATTGKLILNGAGSTLINGAISNGSLATSGTLNYAGSGVLGLNGTSTFSNLLVTSGTVQLGASERLSDTIVLDFTGGVLDMQSFNETVGQINSLTVGSPIVGSGTLALNNVSNTVTLAAGTYSFGSGLQLTTGTAAVRTFNAGVAMVNLNFDGNITEGSAAGGLVLSGSRTLFTLSGSNSYSGGTTLTTGSLVLSSDYELGTGALTTGSGVGTSIATLIVTGGNRTLPGALNQSGTTVIIGSNNLTVNGTTTNLSGATTNTLTNNLSSGTLTLADVSLSSSATAGKWKINGVGDTVINGSIINGSTATSGTLNYAGTGTLFLNGANSLTSMILDSGTVRLGASQTQRDNLLINGATLDLGNFLLSTGTLKTMTANGAVLGSGTLILNGAGNTIATGGAPFTINSTLQITGSVAATRTITTIANDYILFNGPVTQASGLAGSITKGGIPGVLILAGSNSYTGNTTVTGSLGLGSDYALGTGALIVSSTANLFAYGRDVSLSTSGTIQGGTPLLNVTGSNSLALNGKMTGVVTSSIMVTASNSMTSGSFTVGGWALSNSATARTVRFTGGGITVISGTIYNGGANGANTTTSGTLMYSGDGLLVLSNTSGANTYSRTLISSGTVQVGNGLTTGTFGTPLGTGTAINNSFLVFNRPDNLTLSNVINGTGVNVLIGPGNITLSGSNGYSGGTLINNGGLTLSGFANAAGTGDITLGDNGGNKAASLTGGAFTFANDITVQAGSAGTKSIFSSLSFGSPTFSGNINLDDNLTVGAWNTQSVTLSGIITGNKNISATGILGTFNERVILSGNNAATWTGTAAIVSGSMVLGNANALGVNNVVTFLNITGSGTTPATLDVAGNSVTIAGLNDNGLNSRQVYNSGASSTLTLGGAGNYSFGGSITAATPGNIAVTKSGGGTQILSGSSNYSGATNINAGVLVAGHDNAFGTSNVNIAGGTLATTAARTLTNNITMGPGGGTIDSGGGNIVVSGSLGGSTALTTQGVNTVTFNGSGSYNGTATVAAGTLAVNGNIASANVVVNSGATLKGTGTVGAVSVDGTLNAGSGSGSGTLNVASLTLNSGAHLALQVSGTGAGTQYNQVTSTGAITLGNNIASLDLTVTYNPTFTLGDLSASDRIYLAIGNLPATGTFANTTNIYDAAYGRSFDAITASNGSMWALFYGADHTNGATLSGGNDIALYAIPEPTTWAMLLAGFGVLLGMQRFRGRRKT